MPTQQCFADCRTSIQEIKHLIWTMRSPEKKIRKKTCSQCFIKHAPAQRHIQARLCFGSCFSLARVLSLWLYEISAISTTVCLHVYIHFYVQSPSVRSKRASERAREFASSRIALLLCVLWWPKKHFRQSAVRAAYAIVNPYKRIVRT